MPPPNLFYSLHVLVCLNIALNWKTNEPLKVPTIPAPPRDNVGQPRHRRRAALRLMTLVLWSAQAQGKGNKIIAREIYIFFIFF